MSAGRLFYKVGAATLKARHQGKFLLVVFDLISVSIRGLCQKKMELILFPVIATVVM